MTFTNFTFLDDCYSVKNGRPRQIEINKRKKKCESESEKWTSISDFADDLWSRNATRSRMKSLHNSWLTLLKYHSKRKKSTICSVFIIIATTDPHRNCFKLTITCFSIFSSAFVAN
uniref:Uncharacterized protein n=1 Tax=Onchocerca volvulus TaxID=6282 RepID=A0A8R1XUH7_ONCVO